jgi:hypothetical protein
MIPTPLVPFSAVFVDLKDDQVRGEIFSTLQHLDSVINDVFDHIAKRVSLALL